MKKIVLGVCALALATSAVVFANSTPTQATTQLCDSTCVNATCVACPCTPDCQPGDEHCTCPFECTSK